jgi:hypothetical protein
MVPKSKAMPRVVVLPRRRKTIDVRYMLITGTTSFGPFRSEAQAALFATVRWPRHAPDWHIERRGAQR